MPGIQLLLLSWIFTIASAKVFVELIDEMLKEPLQYIIRETICYVTQGDGTWYLAAAGTTGVRPPWESCVKVVIKDTKKIANCTIGYRNHTMTPNRIIFYLGKNEAGITEIRSKGPTHQFMIKTTKIVHGQLSTPAEFRDDISYDAAMHNYACWYGDEEKPLAWRYLLMPVNNNVKVDAFFLIGIRARLQQPEYQIGIFTKGILPQDYVYKLMEDTNRKNRIYFKTMCMKLKSNYGYWFPPYCLPKMYMKCAVGYRLGDMTHKYNKLGPEDDEVKFLYDGERLKMAERDEWSIKNHDSTGTIWVRQQ